MKSAVIIGKGPSILKVKSDYVKTFDDIVICNLPVWSGYEKHIPKIADIQFTNNSTPRFSHEDLKELGLMKIVNTCPSGKLNNLPNYYDSLEVIYPSYKLGNVNKRKTIIFEDSSGNRFDPSTGVIAFSYIVDTKEYQKISMVGFDLLNRGDRMYYFEPEEMQSNLHYLFSNGSIIKEGLIYNQDNLHDQYALEYIIDKIENNPSICFEFITTSNKLIESLKMYDNVSFIR